MNTQEKKFVEHQYPSLYEKTGNILDLNTCLVPLSTMRHFHEMEERMDQIHPLFVMGLATVITLIDDGLITPQMDSIDPDVVDLWKQWANNQAEAISSDINIYDAVTRGVSAMDLHLTEKSNFAQKIEAAKALVSLVRVSEELGLYKEASDDRTTGQVNA